MKTLLSSFLFLLFFAVPAVAHDKKFHKGPMIEGKLLSVQGEKAEVQTQTEKVTVLLSPDTKYETGAEGQVATKADLQAGCALMVYGHKLESGEFGATEVMIGAADRNEPASSAESQAHSHESH